ncbi:hypothetical protein AAZX31_20G069300 [Glycine max]|uniref:Phytocyanin domain-containing protein n=2 Tax=Glycine subgen. Soja TaxID=1462606 RepID=K7N276_SOYBN|nr:umecyanin [Glycine max]XP_028222940.1 umecyanin-like isoform X1 [Glycine soja]KAG4907082.1 hypothetical protein JHK86_055566 [Glycine max]KAG4909713.1 hypothetical protein JHK87_055829 [Glycine soja]KAG5074373.1 hypothetical protein JHK84_055604 [Glycine max]KAG5077051.1 hypothetical protein JHK82_055746 [Glycine max]KAH1035073.1 hypothetical protein GYH30_055167 [Glycine max]|eukprot:XP_006605734.1 umecyanin isoform X1 [Glycine max]
MARNVGLNMIGYSTIAMVFIIGVTKATEYMVGDNFGWNVPSYESFYMDWARTKRFHVGDKLIFSWSGEHSLGIRKDDIYYENCSTSLEGGLTYIFNGATINYTIVSTPGPVYFICTVDDHCERGQKFRINVSAAPALSFGILSAFLSSLAVYFCFTVTS